MYSFIIGGKILVNPSKSENSVTVYVGTTVFKILIID